MKNSTLFVSTLMATFLTLGLVGASAHEYWIEPLQFNLKPGSKIVADIRIGQDFKGNSLAYIAQKYVTSGIATHTGKTAFTSITGDVPALSAMPDGQGLHVLYLSNKPDRLTYKSFDIFVKFVKNTGIEWVLARHKKRGLPEAGFTEAYSRHVKALVQIGPASKSDKDRALGLPIELVAETNPYALPHGPTQKLPVRLLWRGRALAGAQIMVFRRPVGTDRSVKPEIERVRTDNEGRAMITLKTGGTYMLNAVHIVPWSEQPGDLWHSYWASMTFQIKAN